MLGATKLDQPTVVVPAALGAIALISIIISATGMRPLGEAEMQKQIEREDSQLCAKFGMLPGTQPFDACMSDPADLRSRHVKMVTY